jgi:hypothetical protein
MENKATDFKPGPTQGKSGGSLPPGLERKLEHWQEAAETGADKLVKLNHE